MINVQKELFYELMVDYFYNKHKIDYKTSINIIDIKNIKNKYSTIIADYSSFSSRVFYGKSILIYPPIDYYSSNRSFMFELQAWRFLPSLWFDYFNTLDEKYFAFIMVLMLDWYNNKVKSMRFYDMSVGIRAIHISLALELSNFFNLGIEFEELLKNLTNLHIAELKDPKKLTSGNHAIWQMIGLKYLSNTTLQQNCIDYADNNIVQLIEKGFSNEGVSIENSPFYHVYNIELINMILKLDIFQNIHDKLIKIKTKAEDFAKFLIDPNGNYLQIGDSELIKCKKFYTKTLYSQNEYKIQNIYNSGYLILYGKDIYFNMHTPVSYIHAHCDALSFILFFNNIEIITDAGLFDYSYSDLRKWFISNKAHSVISLKNTQNQPEDIDLLESKLNTVKHHNELIEFSGFLSLINTLKTKRKIYFDKNKKIFYINDLIIENYLNDDIELKFILGENIEININNNNNNNNKVFSLKNTNFISNISTDLIYQEKLIAKMYFCFEYKDLIIDKCNISRYFGELKNTNYISIIANKYSDNFLSIIELI